MNATYDEITSFEFVFILHLIIDIMKITYDLCQALQCKSQDIANVVHLASTTKTLIKKLREDEWNLLFEKMKSFCEKYGIDVPNMIAPYTVGRGRSCYQNDLIIIEHHFQVDFFS